MLKRSIRAGVAIFLAWFALDFFLHRLLLRSVYEASADLWRPAGKMNLPLVYFVTVVLIACFVLIYQRLIAPKSIASGIRFGVLYGLITGIAAGFGTYIHMPIPLTLAWGWFLGGVVKGTAAGAIVGAMLKE
jgi:hypothetical protein